MVLLSEVLFFHILASVRGLQNLAYWVFLIQRFQECIIRRLSTRTGVTIDKVTLQVHAMDLFCWMLDFETDEGVAKKTEFLSKIEIEPGTGLGGG